MNFERLLVAKKIEVVEKGEYSEVGAVKDIASAEDNFKCANYDWSVAIAYNAVLRAARGLMQAYGFRPVGREHHKNVFEFLRECGFDEALIDYFDNIRRLRNNFLYEFMETATKESAEESISKAKEFVRKIRTHVRQIRTRK